MLNIWSLKKHTTVKHLLLLLENEFGSDSFLIDTEILLDEKAVYLEHREERSMRAYIFTLWQSKDRYGVHLEFPFDISSKVFLESYENLSYTGLKKVLCDHLDLCQRHRIFNP
ncbi:hypothetical protein SAMN02745866_01831 [Alteromonadaceae bacterium Bs31]|nr:hypothetical protein SAMN02745866_01831 [Alteromonadaceae bacterium Bs31]